MAFVEFNNQRLPVKKLKIVGFMSPIIEIVPRDDEQGRVVATINSQGTTFLGRWQK